MLDSAVTDVPELDGGNEVWLEALPARIFHTPQYGPVEVSPQKLQNMVSNFNKRIRGQDIATDFDHGMDRAKGNQASGWFKEFAVKPSTDDPTQASLYARVELTNDAANEIKDKKWRYFSLEWDDAWMDNDGTVHPDVIMGGAFTNRPIAKKMMPINFSEAMWQDLDYETKKEFAVWSSALVNNLPDSSFLYIQPGGKKDGDGKTSPRSLRHFPYKSSDGKIDLPHLRNAIARIPQAGTWLSESMKTSLQSRARKMLSTMSKAMSEGNDDVIKAFELLTNEGFDVTPTDLDAYFYDQAHPQSDIVPPAQPVPPVVEPAVPSNPPATVPDPADPAAPSNPDEGDSDSKPDEGGNGNETTSETKELEHAEPGTGTPPAPRRDGDGSDELDRQEGWRQPTPPDQTVLPPGTSDEVKIAVAEAVTAFSEKQGSKGGSTYMPITQEEEFELRTILGAGAQGDLVDAGRLMLGELSTLRQQQDAATQERRFAEEYPAYYAEHNKLMNRDRDNSARSFSESVSRVRRAEGFGLKETAKGLSAMSLTKIKDLHVAFAEGKADLDMFEDCIRTIVNGGIVQFGEVGTSGGDNEVPIIDTSSATGIAGARKLFGELVVKYQKENPQKDYQTCIEEVGKRHPDLADAYSLALPA